MRCYINSCLNVVSVANLFFYYNLSKIIAKNSVNLHSIFKVYF